MAAVVSAGFWHNRRVLLTGHTGFKGGWLALETAKARPRLGVQPRWSLHEGIERTIDCYRRQAAGESAIALCEQDIAAYQAAATDAT